MKSKQDQSRKEHHYRLHVAVKRFRKQITSPTTEKHYSLSPWKQDYSKRTIDYYGL